MRQLKTVLRPVGFSPDAIECENGRQFLQHVGGAGGSDVTVDELDLSIEIVGFRIGAFCHGLQGARLIFYPPARGF